MSVTSKSESSARERVLVGLSSAPSNEKTVRTASAMAKAFGADFTAVYIQTPASETVSGENAGRLEKNIRLAKELGATVVTLSGEDVATQLAEYAKVSDTTKIVIGRSAARRKLFSKPPLSERLFLLAPGIDIFIVPDDDSQGENREKKNRKPDIRHIAADIGITAAILSLVTAMNLLFDFFGFADSTIISTYVLGVLIVSVAVNSKICWGLASVASVLTFNFLFTEPKFSLLAYDKSYPVTFAVMFVTALITGSLAAQMKRQAAESAKTAYKTGVLLETDKLLRSAEDENRIFEIVTNRIERLLSRKALTYVSAAWTGDCPAFYGNGDEISREDFISLSSPSKGERRKKSEWSFFTIGSKDAVYGVIGIHCGIKSLTGLEEEIVSAIVGECSLAIENHRNAKEKNLAAIAAENESLKTNILRSVSHDLRSPLTAISGNAANLIHGGDAMDPSTRNGIYSDIYDDSIWLINTVENLLSVTRLEYGKVALHFSVELLDDVISEAISHVPEKASSRIKYVPYTDEMIFVNVDVQLVVQVVLNLVDNAVKYAGESSPITVKFAKIDSEAVVSVEDEGDGIPDENKEMVFGMFCTASKSIADGRRSIGLGLALCRSIITAHGGRISVRDNIPKGCVFEFTLPVKEVGYHE